MRTPAGRDWWLAGLVLLALVVRVWGITWQLPWLLHADEHNYSAVALRMWTNKDPNPHYFINPSLLTYALAAQYGVLRGAYHLAQVLSQELGYTAAQLGIPDHSTQPLGLYLIGRLNVAVLGAATVWGTYILGRSVLNRPWALLGAAFLALNFLHVRNSHYATNDVPATFFLIVSIVSAARLSQSPARKWYLLAGLFGGLATATKYSVGLFPAPILVGHWLAWRQRAVSEPALRLLFQAALTSGIAFVATNPFAVLDWQSFLTDFRLLHEIGLSPWYGQAPSPVPLVQYLLTFVQSMGYVQVLLLIVGLGIGLLRARGGVLLISAFPLVYLLFMSTKPLFFVRFALPLLPPLCVLAAIGGRLLTTQVTAGVRHPSVPILLSFVAILQPAIAIVQHNLLIGRDDTRVLASRWAMENLAGKGAIAVYDPDWDGSLLTLPRPWGGWPAGRRLQFTAAGPSATGSGEASPPAAAARFLAISSYVRDPKRLTALAKGSQWPDTLERWATAQVARGRKLGTFTPGIGGRSVPFRRDDPYTPFWDLGTWARPGPTIMIYELPR
jgi:hypothetical protein